LTRISRLALVALAAAIGGAAPRAPAQGRALTPADRAAGDEWWSLVKAIADDGMDGRYTGSPGYLRAAAFVASQLEAAGLRPAGVDGYFQPVRLDLRHVRAEASSVTLLVDGRSEPVVLGRDAVLESRQLQPASITAPLVFIGYGLHLPEANHDDFDSPEVPLASLRGKIVVFIDGGPAHLPSELRTFARTTPFEGALVASGAVGFIELVTPEAMGDLSWEGLASIISQPGMRLAADPRDAAVAAHHPALADLHRTTFAAVFNPARAEPLFAGTGHSFADLLALATARKPLPHFELKGSVAATVTSDQSSLASPNVVARLEGSDPVLKNEYVVVSAHLDHLGVGAPVNGRTLYAGAMDDASGVATLLALARRFGRERERPRRSLLFVVFTAEEEGLLGSRWFAGRPTVPEAGIVANLNVDMFLPLFALRRLHVQGLLESTLADDARAVGAEHGVEVAADPEPDMGFFARSDQYSFVQAGVPALGMKFGWTAGSPEHEVWRRWLAQRYHSPEDDLSQPVDTAAAAQFNSFLGDLVRRVADAADRPHYVESSFFRRFGR
jgi:Zn-dependent M28 family amino/carboxypeptidase